MKSPTFHSSKQWRLTSNSSSNVAIHKCIKQISSWVHLNRIHEVPAIALCVTLNCRCLESHNKMNLIRERLSLKRTKAVKQFQLTPKKTLHLGRRKKSRGKWLNVWHKPVLSNLDHQQSKDLQWKVHNLHFQALRKQRCLCLSLTFRKCLNNRR